MQIKKKTYRYFNILTILLWSIVSINTHAQIGTEFWFATPYITAGSPSYQLVITTLRQPAHIDIWVGGTQVYSNYFIPTQNTTHILPLVTATITPSLNTPENKGIRITSCEDIIAYFEVVSTTNRDMFSLKAENAMGTRFVVPMQNKWMNGSGSNGSISIVAKENGTNINIQYLQDLFGQAAAPSTIGPIVLNAGQTYTVRANLESAAAHLHGTLITSNRPIAVTTSDDNIRIPSDGFGTTLGDIIGDQILPVSKLGYNHIIPRTNVQIYPDNSNPFIDGSFTGELAFIVATENNTVITVNGIARAPMAAFSMDTIGLKYFASYVKSTKPVVVYQAGGFGQELGGAIIPPVNDTTLKCTGSSEISFFYPEASQLYMSIMVPKGAEDGFYMENSDGTTFIQIPASYFDYVKDNPLWMSLKPQFQRFIAANYNFFTTPGTTVRLKNIYNIFHFGYYTYSSSRGTNYAYFTSYTPDLGDAHIAHYIRNLEYFDVQSKSSKACRGDSMALVSRAGKTYSWKYEDGTTKYLDFPTKPNPKVFGLAPNKTHKFIVTNNRSSCFGTRYDTITIQTSTDVRAMYVANVTQGCSPLNIHFSDSSTGYKIVKNYYINDSLFKATPPVEWDTVLTNDIYSSPLLDTFKLVVIDSLGCPDSITRAVTIYPLIETFIGNIPVTTGCDSLLIQFIDSTITLDTYNWRWEFGDGTSNITSKLLTRAYRNYTNFPVTYNAFFYVTSYYNCRDTAMVPITVYPYVKASFGVDTTTGCAPLFTTIDNAAIGPIANYTWKFGDGTFNSSFSGTRFNHQYDNFTAAPASYTLQQIVTNSQGCTDSAALPIIVFPNVTADIDNTPIVGCSPLTATFTGPPNITLASYEWDFGDSIRSPSQSSVHTYSNRGSDSKTMYSKLLVTSQDGCTDEDSVLVVVHDEVEAIFSINKSDGCANDSFLISNISIYGANYTFDWDYDDGSPISNNTNANYYYHYQNIAAVPVTYNLNLTVRNNKGCLSNVAHPITIYPKVTAGFTSSAIFGCNPLAVQFTNLSTNATIYQWKFGDGSTSFLPNNNISYYNTTNLPKTFPVSLISVSDYACADSAFDTITVASYIKAKFEMDKSFGCSPLTVQFTQNTSGGLQKAFFDFGTGLTDTINSPLFSRTFYNTSLADTLTNIFMRVYNESNCTDSSTLPLSIYPETEASFTIADSSGCQPYSVAFTNTSNLVASSFNWSFGDGNASSDTNPTNIFNNITGNDTVYNVSMIASSVHGCKDTSEIPVTTYAFIAADFKVSVPGVCSGDSITFTIVGSPGNDTFLWDFDNNGTIDSTHSTGIVQMSYFYQPNFKADADVYFPKLMVKNLHDCYDTASASISIYPAAMADFSYDSAGCTPHRLNINNLASITASDFIWQFSDKTTSTAKNPDKIFYNNKEYDIFPSIKLITYTDRNCTDTIEKDAAIYSTPVVFFEPDTIMKCSPHLVTFTNRSTADTFQTKYAWNFDDGYTDSTFNKDPITHQYINYSTDSIDTRNVQVIALTRHNCRDTAYSPIYIYPGTVAMFDVDSAECSPYVAKFENKSVNAQFYEWDFGTGETSVSKNPHHRYVLDTVYQVSLISISKDGCRDTTYTDIRIYPTPYLDFSVYPIYQRFPNATVVLDNQIKESDGSKINSNNPDWDFIISWGDGLVDSILYDSITHTYANWNPTGEFYTINLSVKNPECSDDTSRTITILPPFPVAVFTSDTSACPPFTHQFKNVSEFATTYIWDFGDGSPKDYTVNPSHTYTKPGLFNVQLVAIGEDDVRDTYYQTVRSFEVPQIKFFAEPKQVQLPDATINILDSTLYGKDYYWHINHIRESDQYRGIYDTIEVEVIKQRTASYTFQDSGQFYVWLEVVSDSGCPAVSEAQYLYVLPAAIIKFPNAFSPNMNGGNGGKYNYLDFTNDVFFPYIPPGSEYLIEEYSLEIYTRWGERVFSSNNLKTGWDGYLNGGLCKQDVYVYKCIGSFNNGQTFDLSGDVTLLHNNSR